MNSESKKISLIFTTSHDLTLMRPYPHTGTSLLQVSASDSDGEDNQITYDIYSPNFNFSIDEDGVIRNQDHFPFVPDAEVSIHHCIHK